MGSITRIAKKYLGTDERGAAAVAKLHFPGLDPAAARWLTQNRSIKAIGLDTASIDYGQSTLFESHRILFEKNIPAFENVANLDQLPVKGFSVIALPMKIKGGSGGPLRIIAILYRRIGLRNFGLYFYKAVHHSSRFSQVRDLRVRRRSILCAGSEAVAKRTRLPSRCPVARRRSFSSSYSPIHEPFRDQIAWSKIHFFWSDERHVPPDHPDSNYRMANEAMLSHVPVTKSNVHRVPSENPNAGEAAANTNKH